MDAVVGSKVLVETFGIKEQIRCTLVGWAEHEFVLLRAPLNPGIRSRVTAASQLVVRYLHQGELVGFRAEFQDFTLRPYPFLAVSYPDRFERHALRDRARLNYSCLATISLKGATHRGLMLDLSEGGCRFMFDGTESLPKVKKGDTVEGYFTLLGSPTTYEFHGRVATLDRLKSDREFGIMFEGEKTVLPSDLPAYLNEVSEIVSRLKR